MTEPRDTFDKINREAATPDFAALEARRDRKARRARVSAAAVGLGLTGLLILGAVMFLRDPQRPTQPGSSGTEAPTATPTNGDLLYAKNVEGGWGLFTLDPETGVETQITDGIRDYGSDWSPDGTMVAFDSESGGYGIAVVNADGSERRWLSGGEEGSVPAWSPDGTTIAFTRRLPGVMIETDFGGTSGAHIYVMDADGSNPRAITEGKVADFGPVWSPDGSQILFRRNGEQSGWYLTNADGSGEERRLMDFSIDSIGADFSPDGATIAFAPTGHGKKSPGAGVALMPADGSGEMALVPNTESDSYGVSWPAWSPDGQWIAYVTYPRGPIVLIRPDGTDKRVLEIDGGGDSIAELAWGVAAAPAEVIPPIPPIPPIQPDMDASDDPFSPAPTSPQASIEETTPCSSGMECTVLGSFPTGSRDRCPADFVAPNGKFAREIVEIVKETADTGAVPWEYLDASTQSMYSSQGDYAIKRVAGKPFDMSVLSMDAKAASGAVAALVEANCGPDLVPSVTDVNVNLMRGDREGSVKAVFVATPDGARFWLVAEETTSPS